MPSWDCAALSASFCAQFNSHLSWVHVYNSIMGYYKQGWKHCLYWRSYVSLSLVLIQGSASTVFFCNQGPECTCNADVSWLLKTPCIHVSPVIVLMVWQFLTRETKVYMPVTNEMCVPCPEGLDCQTGADEKDTWRKKNWEECGRWILKNMSLHIDDV